MHPDQFVVLTKFFSPVNNLTIADNGNVLVFHEHARLFAVTAGEERRVEDFIGKRPLTIGPFREILRPSGQRRQNPPQRFEQVGSAVGDMVEW